MHILTKGNCSAKPPHKHKPVLPDQLCNTDSCTTYLFIYSYLQFYFQDFPPAQKLRSKRKCCRAMSVHYEQAQVVREGCLRNSSTTLSKQLLISTTVQHSTSDLLLKHLPRPKHHLPPCNTSHIHPSHLVLYSLLFLFFPSFSVFKAICYIHSALSHQ